MADHMTEDAADASRFPLTLVVWGMLAMALDIGIARLTYGAVLPGLAADLDLSFTGAGVLSAVNLAGYLLGTLVAPRLGKTHGMQWLASAGHAAVACGAAVTALAAEPIVLGIGRALMGTGAGVGLLALFVIVFARTPVRFRAAASTMIWSGIGLALVLNGVLLSHLLGAGEWRRAFFFAAILGVAVTAGLRPGRRGEALPANAQSASRVEEQTRRTDARRWIPLFSSYFMFGVAYIAYSTFAGARLAASGASVTVMSASWVVLGIATIVGCILTAVLLSTPGIRRSALSVILLCGAVGAYLVGFDGALSALLASFFVGLSLAATPAIITANVRQRTSDAAYARVFSLATASLGVGQLVGPVLAGMLADRYGPSAVTTFAAASYALGSVLALADAAFGHGPNGNASGQPSQT